MNPKIKLLLLSSILVLLPGCAVYDKLLDTYFMAGYDTNEYYIITKIRTESEIAQQYCADREKANHTFDKIYAESKVFFNFTENLPRNTNAHELAKNLMALVTQGKNQYVDNDTVSQGFCKLKLQQINRTAESIQKVTGSKAR